MSPLRGDFSMDDPPFLGTILGKGQSGPELCG